MPQIHVKLLDRRWAVVLPESGRVVSSHERRDDAIRAALRKADTERAELVVFSLGGTPLGHGQSWVIASA